MCPHRDSQPKILNRVSEGHAFAVHDPDVFMTDIAPQFFDKQSRLRSFHRQLSIWVSSLHAVFDGSLDQHVCPTHSIGFTFLSPTPQGFSRLETGAAGRGVWFHKYFIRDKPDLIKLIKRVPVKNPKLTLPTSKDQLPDYTKYQLPSSPQTASGHATTIAMNSLPANHDVVAAAAMNGGIATSEFLLSNSMRPPQSLPNPDRLDYLSTLAGRLPPALHPRYFAAHNTPLQAPDGSASSSVVTDQSRVYQQALPLTNYPPGVTSASLLQHQALVGGNPNPPYEVGEVAQQLIACRNNPSSQNPNGHWDNNIDTAILEFIMDSRRQNVATPNIHMNSVGMNMRRDFYPQGQPPF